MPEMALAVLVGTFAEASERLAGLDDFQLLGSARPESFPDQPRSRWDLEDPENDLLCEHIRTELRLDLRAAFDPCPTTNDEHIFTQSMFVCVGGGRLKVLVSSVVGEDCLSEEEIYEVICSSPAARLDAFNRLLFPGHLDAGLNIPALQGQLSARPSTHAANYSRDIQRILPIATGATVFGSIVGDTSIRARLS